MTSGWVLIALLTLGCSRARSVDAEPLPLRGETPTLVSWPKATDDRAVEKTIQVSGHFDGGMARFHGAAGLATSDQDEHQGALFELTDGSLLSNVILGAPAADGVHCRGSCTLQNVWWEDVGEDAATFIGQSAADSMRIETGGARAAEDKVFQDNGLGTMYIRDFYVESFGKLFRSCGNCAKQMDRHVVVENLTALAGEDTAAIVGLNLNYGDTAEFIGNNVIYAAKSSLPICLLYQANDKGAEPESLGPAPDGDNCKRANVHVQRLVSQ